MATERPVSPEAFEYRRNQLLVYPSHGSPITLRESRLSGLNARPPDEETDKLPFQLNERYAESRQRSSTDIDERNSHDNAIITIIVGSGPPIFYQMDKGWHHLTDVRRCVSRNGKSCWKKTESAKGKQVLSIFTYPDRNHPFHSHDSPAAIIRAFPAQLLK